MTSLNEAAGTGTFIELGGRKFQASPIVPEDLEAAREWLKSKTISPLEDLKTQIVGLPEAVQIKLAEKAYDAYERWGSLNTVQGQTWANSLEGLAFFFWRSIRHNHPDITIEWCIQEVATMSLRRANDVKRKLDQVSGADLGNVPGPTPSVNLSKKLTAERAALKRKKQNRLAKKSKR